jgi:DNA-binding MurR/RpiR family transcriptional regulator
MANNINVAVSDSGSNRSEIEKYENELERLRKDYATLTENEKAVIYLIVICKNTDYLMECISDQLEIIDNLINIDAVPASKEVYDFSEFKERENNKMVMANDDYMEMLQETAAKIDELKEIIAGKIVTAQNNLQNAIYRASVERIQKYGFGNH